MKVAHAKLADFESEIISLVDGKTLNLRQEELESLYKLEQQSVDALKQQLISRSEDLEAAQKVISSLTDKVKSLEDAIEALNERQKELGYVNALEKEALEPVEAPRQNRTRKTQELHSSLQRNAWTDRIRVLGDERASVEHCPSNEVVEEQGCQVKECKESGELEMLGMSHREQKASKHSRALKEVQYLELSHNNPVIANKVARATLLSTVLASVIPNTISTPISTDAASFDVFAVGVDTNISLESLAETSAFHETNSSRGIGEQRRCTRALNTLAVARTVVSGKGGPMISSIKQVPSSASKAPNLAF